MNRHYAKLEPIPVQTAGPEQVPDEDIPREIQALKTPGPPEVPIAESGFQMDEKEKYLLAKIAEAEAGNQDTEGKALVILVVINRMRAQGFPDTAEGVIYQGNQFSPIREGTFDAAEPDADCYKALGMVLEGWDESQGALYFESEGRSEWHRDNLEYLFTHGSHLFYTDREDAG